MDGGTYATLVPVRVGLATAQLEPAHATVDSRELTAQSADQTFLEPLVSLALVVHMACVMTPLLETACVSAEKGLLGQVVMHAQLATMENHVLHVNAIERPAFAWMELLKTEHVSVLLDFLEVDAPRRHGVLGTLQPLEE